MKAARPAILIWVTHVLGIGHYRRALALAAACAEAGLVPIVASGGMPVPGGAPDGVTVAQLPAVRSAGTSFVDLLDAEGRPADAALFARRADMLLSLYEQHAPRAVITELFPFGRRLFAAEIEALLERARDDARRPAILASVRDILQPPSKPERLDDMARRLARYYDRVLVHGDPALIRLEQSLPLAGALSHMIDYTGYIGGGAAPQPAPGEGEGEVIVSAGGGAVGRQLLTTAVKARALSGAGDRVWRLLVGHNLPHADREKLAAAAGDGVIVEPARADFPGLLSRARLSISQAGYNTCTDILAARIPAVLVPFADDGEVEQTMRARLFAARGLAVVVAADALDPRGLAEAVNQALRLEPAEVARPRLDGAATAARLIGEAVTERQA